MARQVLGVVQFVLHNLIVYGRGHSAAPVCTKTSFFWRRLLLVGRLSGTLLATDAVRVAGLEDNPLNKCRSFGAVRGL